jgi:hypothetical protein
MTEADLAGCTMRKDAHFNGGKEWFGYLMRCNEHPRLTRMDKYLRKTRSAETTWNVDGKPVADLAEAVDKLSRPYEPTPDELKLLAEVPDEFFLFEIRLRFLPLRDVGLIEFKDGACRRTDAGRAALRSQSSSAGSR